MSRALLSLSVLLAMPLLLPACFPGGPSMEALPPPPPPPPPPVLTLIAAGDVIPHGSIKSSAARQGALTENPAGNGGWDSLFAEIKATAAAADLAILNLETPIAPIRNGATASMVFNAPLELAKAIKDAGFDAVSIANNHVWDQTIKGMLETVTHLDEVGLIHAGAGPTCEAAQQYQIFEHNGLKIGWISTTSIHNAHNNKGPGDPCVFSFDVPKILAAAERARKEGGAELVLASIHWGVEYQNTPWPSDRANAYKLLDGGIDGILGHHPHVLQPIEWRDTPDGRRAFVVFSMGNFITGQGLEYVPGSVTSAGLRRDGLMVRVRMERVDGKAKVTKLEAIPTWAEKGSRACFAEGSSVMRILPTFAAMKAAQADPSLALCAKHYAQRIEVVKKIVGAEWIAEE